MNGNEMYDGLWNNDMRNGQGSQSYQNGDKYVGEYLNDVKHGEGTFEYGPNSTHTQASYNG